MWNEIVTEAAFPGGKAFSCWYSYLVNRYFCCNFYVVSRLTELQGFLGGRELVQFQFIKSYISTQMEQLDKLDRVGNYFSQVIIKNQGLKGQMCN